MRKLRSGDSVIVISGKFKGKVGTIEKISLKTRKIAGKNVEELYATIPGINEVKKAVKEKGFVTVTKPLPCSNLALEKDGKPVKVGIKIDGDKKYRIDKKTGQKI